jgi:hypothetical protein
LSYTAPPALEFKYDFGKFEFGNFT